MNNINYQNIDNLLQFIILEAGRSDEFLSRSLGEIHLIKYVYLADLKFAENNNGKTYTSLPWKFHHFGPWEQSLWKRIDTALEAIKAEKTELSSDKFGDFVRWKIQDEKLYEAKREILPLSIKGSLSQDIQKFGNDTSGLLHFVYNTIPMKKAAPEDFLDFKTAIIILPKFGHYEEELKLKLTPRQMKKRKEKIIDFKKKINERLTIEEDDEVVVMPNYDDTFFEGLEWLNSLGGDEIEPKKATAIISDDVWKSKARFDENLYY